MSPLFRGRVDDATNVSSSNVVWRDFRSRILVAVGVACFFAILKPCIADGLALKF